jgi:phage tail-like protein
VPGPSPTNNYIGSFNFRIKVEGFETDLDGFISCSGVKAVSEVYDFQHGLDTHTRKAIGRSMYEPVTLERAYSGLDEFAAWRERIENGVHERREVVIEYLTANKKVVSRFRLQGAFPARWESPDLNASSSEAAVERIELEFEVAVREASGEHLKEDAWWAGEEQQGVRVRVFPDEPGWVRGNEPPPATSRRAFPDEPGWVRGNEPPTYPRRTQQYPDWVLKY